MSKIQFIKDSGRTGLLMAFSVVMPVIGMSLIAIYIKEISNSVDPTLITTAILYTLSAIILVGTSFTPSHVFALLGGWLFGFSLGLFYSFTGICLAAIVGFLISRLLNCQQLCDRLSHYPQTELVIKTIRDKKQESLYTIITLMRLSPVIPFSMTNILLASLRVPLKQFFLATCLGMFPRTAIMVYAGSQLQTLNFDKPSSLPILLIGIGFTLTLLLVMGKISKKILSQELQAST